jgi:hypothetical protein
MNFDKSGMFDEKHYAAWLAKIKEHFHTCTQCSVEGPREVTEFSPSAVRRGPSV